jgi:tRNA(Ile)-lysidine synthase
VDHNPSVPTTLEARVADHCRRHGLLPAGAPVLAMVSGGADSTCLMHLLAALHDGPVGVLAVDHGLRPGSRDEALAVLEAAAALGLAGHLESLDLEPGPGVQERAREARLAAARRVAERGGYARVATGHTASDQAETVLFRLARGAGRAGALGMAPRRGPFVRPLLCLSAAQTRAWCEARGIEVVRDPSNEDPAHARARVRAGLVPALAAVHPGAERHVAAFADLLRDEAQLLEPLVDAAWARAREGGPGLGAEALAAEPAPMRRLLVRRLIAEAGLPGEAMGAEPVARALALLDGGRRAGLPGDGEAALARGRLVVSGPAPPAPQAAPLPVPGRAVFGAVAVRASQGEGCAPGPRRVAVRADGPLVVRPPRPGDRLPLPGGGRRAVGRLLAEGGVPARLRAGVPVVATPERVVWVAGHRAADDLLAPAGAPAVLLDLEPA